MDACLTVSKPEGTPQTTDNKTITPKDKSSEGTQLDAGANETLSQAQGIVS